MSNMEGKKHIMAALLAYQANEKGFEADKKGNRNQYASIGAVINTAKMANKYGITFSQPTAVHFENGHTHMIQRTILMHAESGETLEGDYPIIVDDMTNSQKVGGAVTYAKRYLLAAMLGTEKGVEDTDDDGAMNGDYQDPPKTEPQVVSSLPEGRKPASPSPQIGGAGTPKTLKDMGFEEVINLINEKYAGCKTESAKDRLLSAGLEKANSDDDLLTLTNALRSTDVKVLNRIAERRAQIV